MSKQNILFALAGAALVGVIWVAMHFFGTSEPQVIRGSFEVSYFTWNNKSGTEGGGSDLKGVSAIRLCPGYVVVEQQNGEARVFFSEYTQKLGWKRADATAEKK